MTSLLLHLQGVDENDWAVRFRAALPFLQVFTRDSAYDPGQIDYALVWKPAPDAFAGLDGLKAVFSYGAGVDALLQHPHLPDVPLVRFVDPDLTSRMTDYVVAQVTLHARLTARFQRQQAARQWAPIDPPGFGEVSVGLMGLGQLGTAAATALNGLGFAVRGWSRAPKSLAGVDCFSGAAELDAFLAGTDILCCLLPLTPETTGVLNQALFRKLRRRLPDGPVVINAARGGHLVEADLVAALTDGTLAAASVDVFAPEPLPASSPLWGLPNCFITPHVAAVSTAAAGVAYFSRIIVTHAAGEPLPNVVDRQRGY